VLGVDARFDVVFEATGVARSIHDGLEVLRFGGTLVTLGIHHAPVAVDVTRLVRQQQQLRGSHRAPRSTWERVLRFLAEHGEKLRPMITHRFALAQAAQAFDLARSRRASKVMIRPN
jgi:threonine dehydrogenase-like Zn-dependent dehydrogenase